MCDVPPRWSCPQRVQWHVISSETYACPMHTACLSNWAHLNQKLHLRGFLLTQITSLFCNSTSKTPCPPSSQKTLVLFSISLHLVHQLRFAKRPLKFILNLTFFTTPLGTIIAQTQASRVSTWSLSVVLDFPFCSYMQHCGLVVAARETSREKPRMSFSCQNSPIVSIATKWRGRLTRLWVIRLLSPYFFLPLLCSLGLRQNQDSQQPASDYVFGLFCLEHNMWGFPCLLLHFIQFRCHYLPKGSPFPSSQPDLPCLLSKSIYLYLKAVYIWYMHVLFSGVLFKLSRMYAV